MANIQPVLRIEINPAQPVQEVCDVIAAVLAYHPGAEIEVLKKLEDAIAGHLKTLEVNDNGKNVEADHAKRKNQR